MSDYIVVFVTTTSEEQARTIAKQLKWIDEVTGD